MPPEASDGVREAKTTTQDGNDGQVPYLSKSIASSKSSGMK